MKIAVVLLASLSVLITVDIQSAEPAKLDHRPITQIDLDRVWADWAKRDLSARDVIVVNEETRKEFKLLIVKHDVNSRAHFGAIFVPNVDDLSNAPVVLLPDGLEQWNPTIDVENNIKKFLEYEPVEPLNRFIKILPAFRGRFMSYQDNGWFSRGAFCDAYDGPTDDSIAMLNAAETLFPEVSFENVLAWGGSRRGNTALLMSIRDARVSTVIAPAAPVDFYRESWQSDGGDQYRCQFFDGKSDSEARHRILASSPLFFEPHENLETVFLHHDEGDDIVPLWNAQEIAAHLESHSVNVTTFIYPTEGHGYMVAEDSFWENINVELSEIVIGIGH